MTPEEACEYLDISLDDELDPVVLERNYRAKLSRFGDSPVNHKRIDDAYDLLRELYKELYTDESAHRVNKGWFVKTAALFAVMFVLGYVAASFFVDWFRSENVTIKNETVSMRDYEILLRELDELRNLQAASQQQTPSVTPPADYAELVEQVMPSMVLIQTNKSRGSGFFVSAGGDILTNHHVIDGASSITVTTHDGRRADALVKDYDSVRDMALLKVNLSQSAPFLRISNNLPRQGEAVLAIGNPRGFNETVSNGIVSAIREVDNNLFVQFTAPVSPGSSGGALVNLHGEVVGMPTVIRTDGQNLNFAAAPTVMNKFLGSAVNKPARTLPRRPAASSSAESDISIIPGAKFVRKDDGYEMYLDTEHIDYNRNTGIASFITYWWPTEKTKNEMRKDSHFTIAPGADLGLCALLYMADFTDNTYVHLRTVNLCTNGEIARDYTRPQSEIKWRTPKKGSRPEALMNAVKRQLRIR